VTNRYLTPESGTGLRHSVRANTKGHTQVRLTELRSAAGMIIDAAGQRSEQVRFPKQEPRQQQRGVRRPAV